MGDGIQTSEIMVLDSRDGGTLFSFADPGGNTWTTLQQIRARAELPLIPR